MIGWIVRAGRRRASQVKRAATVAGSARTRATSLICCPRAPRRPNLLRPPRLDAPDRIRTRRCPRAFRARVEIPIRAGRSVSDIGLLPVSMPRLPARSACDRVGPPTFASGARLAKPNNVPGGIIGAGCCWGADQIVRARVERITVDVVERQPVEAPVRRNDRAVQTYDRPVYVRADENSAAAIDVLHDILGDRAVADRQVAVQAPAAHDAAARVRVISGNSAVADLCAFRDREPAAVVGTGSPRSSNRRSGSKHSWRH